MEATNPKRNKKPQDTASHNSYRKGVADKREEVFQAIELLALLDILEKDSRTNKGGPA